MKSNINIGSQICSVESDDDYLNAMGSEFEPHMVSLFEELIGSDDIVYDVGANIGLTAILFSNIAKKVVAFEPSPSTYSILCNNLSLNDVKHVIKNNIGLGEKQETLSITFAQNNRSGGFVSNKTNLTQGHTTEEIGIDTLDNFISHNKDLIPSFIKIDVEGFEQNVIRGGDKYASAA